MSDLRPASMPPDTCRSVMLIFEGTEADCVGFWWAAEKLWYRRYGSKRRSNAVNPVQWRELNDSDKQFILGESHAS